MNDVLEMDRQQCIAKLQRMIKAGELRINQLNRKRSMRASEKAMSIGIAKEGIAALNFAIRYMSDKPCPLETDENIGSVSPLDRLIGPS